MRYINPATPKKHPIGISSLDVGQDLQGQLGRQFCNRLRVKNRINC